MASLTGTGRLADDVYLLAHHEVSGRPFLHARALGVGLAGAFLARTAAREVADRLAASGYLTRPGRGRRAGRWLPVNADCAFAPLIRVRAALARPARQRSSASCWLAWLPRAALAPGPCPTARPTHANTSTTRSGSLA
jgi:hypothetical protein